jgi:hypothetical protein
MAALYRHRGAEPKMARKFRSWNRDKAAALGIHEPSTRYDETYAIKQWRRQGNSAFQAAFDMLSKGPLRSGHQRYAKDRWQFGKKYTECEAKETELRRVAYEKDCSAASECPSTLESFVMRLTRCSPELDINKAYMYVV